MTKIKYIMESRATKCPRLQDGMCCLLDKSFYSLTSCPIDCLCTRKVQRIYQWLCEYQNVKNFSKGEMLQTLKVWASYYSDDDYDTIHFRLKKIFTPKKADIILDEINPADAFPLLYIAYLECSSSFGNFPDVI